MEVIAFVLLFVAVELSSLEISRLKKQVAQQQKQLDELCALTGQESLASGYISDAMKSELLALKEAGKDVRAVKKLRKHTTMSLLEAKEYIDKLL